jgi:hypothetical protein
MESKRLKAKLNSFVWAPARWIYMQYLTCMFVSDKSGFWNDFMSSFPIMLSALYLHSCYTVPSFLLCECAVGPQCSHYECKRLYICLKLNLVLLTNVYKLMDRQGKVGCSCHKIHFPSICIYSQSKACKRCANAEYSNFVFKYYSNDRNRAKETTKHGTMEELMLIRMFSSFWIIQAVCPLHRECVLKLIRLSKLHTTRV